MALFVVDASVALAWCFEDEDTPLATRAMDALAVDGAVVPAIWVLEVANALLVSERRRRIVPLDTARYVAMLRDLPIDVDTDSVKGIPQRAIELARTHALTCYDACYLELALRLGLPLATQDHALLRAMAACGVAAF